jgi:hypothetical protein
MPFFLSVKPKNGPKFLSAKVNEVVIPSRNFWTKKKLVGAFFPNGYSSGPPRDYVVDADAHGFWRQMVAVAHGETAGLPDLNGAIRAALAN